MLPAEAWGRVLCVLGKLSVSLGVQGPLIVTEELHSLSFESELQLNQSGLDIKLEVRPAACPLFMLRIKLELIEEIKPCCFLLSFFFISRPFLCPWSSSPTSASYPAAGPPSSGTTC